MSVEYSKKYGQVTVFTTDLKNNPSPYLVKCLLDVIKKKTKVLDSFNTDKKCFIKNNIESSLQEIWIRIHFLEINGSPSLVLTQLPGFYACYELFTCGPLDYKYAIAPKHGFIILSDIIVIG